MDLGILVDDLVQEEGYKSLLYDDKTGKLLKQGDTIQGNPTIGNGWNVSGKPLSPERARIITTWFAQDAYDDLLKALPWIETSPNDIQVALTDMSYNLGIESLVKFTTFLSMIRSGNYSIAADDLKTTLWAKQVGSRAVKIEGLIRNAKH